VKKKKMRPSRKKSRPWVAAAERALRRAARKVRAEHKRLGLPLIVWENGKVVEKWL
jgi:hypothetical protein